MRIARVYTKFWNFRPRIFRFTIRGRGLGRVGTEATVKKAHGKIMIKTPQVDTKPSTCYVIPSILLVRAALSANEKETNPTVALWLWQLRALQGWILQP